MTMWLLQIDPPPRSAVLPMRVLELRGEWPYEGDESVENTSWFIWRMSIHFPKLETLGILESMYGPINTLRLSIHSFARDADFRSPQQYARGDERVFDAS